VDRVKDTAHVFRFKFQLGPMPVSVQERVGRQRVVSLRTLHVSEIGLVSLRFQMASRSKANLALAKRRVTKLNQTLWEVRVSETQHVHQLRHP
jgi:hypothetical protein